MLKRTFSNREKVLLLVLALLVIGIGYYLTVWQPVSARVDAAALRQADAEDAYAIEAVRLVQMQKMQAELAALDAFEADQNAAVIPPYDNAKKVMQLLNGILTAAQSYEISFANVETQGNLALRTLNMRFVCTSYDNAKTILRALYAGPYRCRIGTMTFRGQDGDIQTSPVAVETEITFYEFLSNVEDAATEAGS
ncbi:MAG: hypothetical protein Q4E65_04140 [Clostridia bacterium]|nr:hypothetical protein [Clostridia bacterium]